MKTHEKNLEPNRETRERWLRILDDFVQTHLDDLHSRPAFSETFAQGLEIADHVSLPVGEEPVDGGIESLIDRLARAFDASFVTPGPGYLAFVPGGGIYAGALGDYVQASLNRFTALAVESPALCRLEWDMLRWLISEYGWGDNALGTFTSGASLANTSAVLTARHAHFGESGDFRRALAYVSSQSHYSLAKALRVVGIPAHNIRSVAIDRRYRMCPNDLAQQIHADREAGASPFLVVSTAGTTNTGAVDPLQDIAAVARREHLWHHVDAAYGGAFVLCPEGREALQGIEDADSIAMDAHKGLFLPFGMGCLLVRNGEALRAAHRYDAEYLVEAGAGEAPSPAHLGLELTRPFRGLRLWMALMLHGAGAFRRALSEKIQLARTFYEEMASAVQAGLDVELVDTPQLSIVPFRLSRRDGEPLSRWNARNLAWLEAINRKGRVFLSKTALPVEDGDAITLRVCVLSFRVHRERVMAGLEDLRETALMNR